MHVYEAAPKMDLTLLSVYIWIHGQDIIMAPQGAYSAQVQADPASKFG